MSNFEIHELTEKAINRNSNIIHDTLYGEDYETGKDTAGAVADLALEVVASMYDDTASYAIGSYCIYSGVLYRCTTATTGAFDVSDWTAVLITGEYKRVRVMHKADFDLLTPEEQADGMIFVDDVDITADDISYSAGVSVADKIDDIVGKLHIEAGKKQASSTQAVRVTFAQAYTTIPHVVIVPNNSTSPRECIRSCTVTAITTTYFEFVEQAIGKQLNTFLNGTDDCEWIAYGV